MEKSFVLFKPDAVQRGLLGECVRRFEAKGLKLLACKMIWLDDKMLDVHYAHHKGKPFFPRLKQFMKTSPCLATVWEGVEAVKVARDLVGATNGRNALPGTLRGDFSVSTQSNLVHASDSVESAEAEVKRFFKNEEVFDWKRNEALYYADDEASK